MVEVDDDTLVAELREAFGPDSAGLSPRSGRSSSSGSVRVAGVPRSNADDLPPGTRIADFEIVEELGRGGMGVVYRARQLSLGRDVALKVLPAYARHRRAAVKRFRVEAQAAARLQHNNIVPIFAHGEEDGRFYYVMELIEGRGLDEVLAHEPDLLSSTAAVRSKIALESGWLKGKHQASSAADRPGQPTDKGVSPLFQQAAAEKGDRPLVHWTRPDYVHVARLFAEVADGLEHAHHHGVIHRDIKPPNVMFGADARLHITDFGLARLMDEPNVTLSGELLGTPAYLAPEQLQGDPRSVDHRTDIYSFGVTLYEVLTGQRPFTGGTRDQVIHEICTKEPAPLRKIAPRVPRDLETICLRAMEKDPARRFGSAGLLAEELRRFADDRPILSKPIGTAERAWRWSRRDKARMVAAALLVVAVLLGGGITLQVRSSRIERGNRLAEDAYYTLTYVDYTRPEFVEDELNQAADLGADSLSFALASGLASIGRAKPAEAVDMLEAAVASDPENVEALYLLAFAQRKNKELDASRQTYQRAEDLGGPNSPPAWFFRGMAVHYFNAEESIESFRQAQAARQQQGAFFPQAVLHLGRAYNQCLYADRSEECFDEATIWLTSLVNQNSYGAYPYYLLSIAHHLLAEIKADYSCTRTDEAQAHFEKSLQWATGGQSVDPAHTWSIMAEAECREAMCEFTEAIAVRTRAIESAQNERNRCENYHYRWRLNFWTGNWEAATQDVQRHAQCDPQSLAYAYVYPALIHADAGELDQALELADLLIADGAEPGRIIWAAALFHLLGTPEDADRLLADSAELFQTPAQPDSAEQRLQLAVYDLYTGRASAVDLLEGADKTADRGALIGAVNYHAGILALSSGNRDGAMAYFEAAHRVFDSETGFTFHADVLRRKMQLDAAWPGWLGPLQSADSIGG